MKIQVSGDVVARNLAGEAVRLVLATGTYFGLDEVGTRMWQLVTESDSLQAAYDKLVQEYEVDPEELRRDLSELLEALAGRGLIEIDAV